MRIPFIVLYNFLKREIRMLRQCQKYKHFCPLFDKRGDDDYMVFQTYRMSEKLTHYFSDEDPYIFSFRLDVAGIYALLKSPFKEMLISNTVPRFEWLVPIF